MMLTDLADACRKSGLRVVEVNGWRTRGHGQMSGVRSIICHHTAGPRNGNSPSLGVVINGHASLRGPLSQLFLARDGTVHVVAAGLSYHAGVVFDTAVQSNPWAIGIEAEATGVDPWPADQYAAYVRLCKSLAEHYRVPVARVLGHKEIAKPRGRKIDPNFDMDAFRDAVLRTAGPGPVPGRRGMVKMIEREIVKGDNYFRIICPVGKVSEIVGRAWVSITAAGGFESSVAFQYSADTNDAAPGTAPVWHSGGPNAMRRWAEIPSGTEYIEVWVKANGGGSVLVECQPK